MIKKFFIAMLLATAVLFACSAGGKTEKSAGAQTASTASTGGIGVDADVSYSFGVVLGMNLKMDLEQMGIQFDFDYDAITQGFRAAVEGKDTRFSADAAYEKIQEALTMAMTEKADANLREGTEFLAENGRKSGVITTASGLQYEAITEGTGPKPAAWDRVLVDYEGSLLDGTVFDSSYARGESAEIPLSEVIPGWTEGIQLMKVGSTYRFWIPADLAYGSQGAGNVIPPNAILVFKVELHSIL